jgi:hypothetical protein
MMATLKKREEIRNKKDINFMKYSKKLKYDYK